MWQGSLNLILNNCNSWNFEQNGFEFGLVFLEGHNLPCIFLHPFLVKAPFLEIFSTSVLMIKHAFQQKFYRNPPLQTIVFNGTFFFSFNLEPKEK